MRQKERKKKEAEKLADETKQLEKAEKNLKDRKRKLGEKEKDLTKEEKELFEELKMSEKLYKEANERLSKAIQNKNFEDASVAQALYEAAQKRINDTNARLQKCLKKREEISSKRRKVMDEYSQKFSTKTSKKENCFVTCFAYALCTNLPYCFLLFADLKVN